MFLVSFLWLSFVFILLIDINYLDNISIIMKKGKSFKNEKMQQAVYNFRQSKDQTKDF